MAKHTEKMGTLLRRNPPCNAIQQGCIHRPVVSGKLRYSNQCYMRRARCGAWCGVAFSMPFWLIGFSMPHAGAGVSKTSQATLWE